MEISSTVIDLQYLPCLEYFLVLALSEDTCIDIHEHYEKQSYRNRCQILTANGIQALSIPILKPRTHKKIKDVQIDYTQKWVQVHWRAITSAYGKAPFFEYYADEFYKVYTKKHRYLIDLNLEFLRICCLFLGWSKEFKLSEKYVELSGSNTLTDLRSLIHPKKKSEIIGRFGIPQYQQVFGKGFVHTVSIIDLLFCEGANASNILKSGIKYA